MSRPNSSPTRPDVIFLLASIVSGEAEADFDKGYSHQPRRSAACSRGVRREQALSGGAYRPRLVFTSSIAVFGAPFPEAIGDEFFLTPLTSYGTQKAILELLLADYSRRGFLDGVGVRLPTITVRPGAPNKAASGFFSGIMREPLAGKEARSARRRQRQALARLAAFGGRFPHSRRDDGHRPARRSPQPDHARRQRHGRRADRGARPASPARTERRNSFGASRTRLSSALSPAGREHSTPRAPRNLGFVAERTFDEFFALILRMNMSVLAPEQLHENADALADRSAEATASLRAGRDGSASPVGCWRSPSPRSFLTLGIVLCDASVGLARKLSARAAGRGGNSGDGVRRPPAVAAVARI